MQGSFFGIEMGKRSLQQFQTGLNVVGHNISNTATEGYSRQRVMMKTLPPLYDPSLNRPERAGQVGQGMLITDIERLRDAFVDSRINFEKHGQGYWNMRKEYLSQMEAVHNEPSALNMRSDLDAFWSAWQEVANNPAERAQRSLLVERATRIADNVNTSYRQLKNLRDNANVKIETQTKRINDISRSIRELNEQIRKSQALGDNPNDLLDKRDLLFEELSTIADVTLKNVDPNETIVYIGSRHLIQGELVSELEIYYDPANEGYARARWALDGVDVDFRSGEMRGLMEIRDVDLVHAINDLDVFAQNLTDAVNEIHRDGFGANEQTGIDFFHAMPITPSAVGNYDPNNTGAPVSALFKTVGLQSINEKDALGTTGALTFGNVNRNGANVTVQYNANDTVEDVIKRINNSDANVVAYTDHRGRLVLKARVHDDYLKPNFVISHIEDSGDFLVGFAGLLANRGAEGAFNASLPDQYAQLAGDGRHFAVTPHHHPSEWMKVNATIRDNVDYIAAAKGIDTDGSGSFDKANGIGDGGNALQIANLRVKPVMIDSHSTFDDYYADIVGDIAARTETAHVEADKQDAMLSYLTKLRQSISGVNLDEEMAEMMVYQHGYNASARVVTMMDSLLDVVINRMGV